MAYDEGVAERIRDLFLDRHDVLEKKMFGGIAFMLKGKMCCGVVNDTLMARVGPEQYSAALKKQHAREMDFTGKPMRVSSLLIRPVSRRTRSSRNGCRNVCSLCSPYRTSNGANNRYDFRTV